MTCKLWRKNPYALLFLVGCLLLVATTSCRREQRLTVAEWRTLAAAERAKFKDCIPDSQPDDKVYLALAAINVEADQTRVKIVAYALGEAADFYLPQYSMSRGRWMINERGRSYIRDAKCEEYKLKDRTPTVGKVPNDGRISLKSGEAYEVTLSYPRLPEGVQSGVLVYDKWVMPFSLK